MSKCRYCGREAAPEFRFCPFCGGELSGENGAEVFLLQKPAQGEEVLYRSWEEVCAVTGEDPAKLLRQQKETVKVPAAEKPGVTGQEKP